MAELTRLAWQALVADTVDTSPGNPCLLTLANRSPQRIEAAAGTNPARPTGGLFSATTVGAGGAAAGQAAVPVGSTANWRDGMDVWLGAAGVGSQGEAARVARGGVGAGQLTMAGNLQYPHAAGALVSPLPTIVSSSEPRGVIDTPDHYWSVVVGPEHEYPSTEVRQRAPTRLYEGLLTVKVYDAQPSRKLAEDVRDRLDWLLNLGEAGCPNPTNGGLNPSPLLGAAGGLIWLERLELVPGADPHFDYSSLSLQIPLHFRADYSKQYS